MKTIGIFYGSSTGTTEDIAKRIAAKLGVDASNLYDVAKASPSDLAGYEVLILGSSTWGAGDLQDDWYDFLAKIKKLDLFGKFVAIFGCGDSSSFSDTFCDAIGTIYTDLQDTGCTFIGNVATDGYSYDDSAAVIDGQFVGLPLDELNEDDQTESRLDSWIDSLKKEGLE
ncbi:flavodoxin FldA [Parabacteroides goldsteinii]|uniref:flavodoxin FldA n=1 Tax=Parabacteroides goldsteinii TaxID=328812 RepID=UPI00101DBF50|nr:flavodoxin FldA [Parabacteroides goldsteinii]